MTTLLDKILDTVKQRKIKITVFAKAIGLSRPGIYKLTDDTIKYATIKKIARYLNLPVSYFINDDDLDKTKLKIAKSEKTKAKNQKEWANRHADLLNQLAAIQAELKKELKKLNK